MLRVRTASAAFESAARFDEAVDEIEQLEARAFRELMDERLAADESFGIFAALAAETVAVLERRRDRMVQRTGSEPVASADPRQA